MLTLGRAPYSNLPHSLSLLISYNDPFSLVPCLELFQIYLFLVVSLCLHGLKMFLNPNFILYFHYIDLFSTISSIFFACIEAKYYK